MLNQRVSRRGLMRASVGALLAAGVWPGRLGAEGVGVGKLRFVVINDLHYVDGKCSPFFEQVVRQVKGVEGLDFCAIAGDLSEDGTAGQIGAVRDLFKGVGVPVHVMCGNHDWTKEQKRAAWEEIYPKAINYTFEGNGWQFVVLDTTDGTKANVAVKEGTLKYLDEVAGKLDRKRPVVVLTHFPLGPGTPMRPSNADALLGRLKEHNLVGTFGGHHHGFTERVVDRAGGGKTVMVTNKCCSFRKANHDKSVGKGFFVVTAGGDGTIQREFVEVKFAGKVEAPKAKAAMTYQELVRHGQLY